jgi:tRNA(adenine34) deaminase
MPSNEQALHETHMRCCLALGRAALEAGEVPVGALVVRDDIVLGEGFERVRGLLDLSAHAEVQAIRAACQKLQSVDLSGCTLYTTVEPCVLCAYVVRRAGMSRVVYGIPAGQVGGLTSRYALLADSSPGWPEPPEILSGVLGEECHALLQERKGLPQGHAALRRFFAIEGPING